jgi:hypothetical protein
LHEQGTGIAAAVFAAEYGDRLHSKGEHIRAATRCTWAAAGFRSYKSVENHTTRYTNVAFLIVKRPESSEK